MHKYRYKISIGLPCSECGTMNVDVITEILNNHFINIPAVDIEVEQLTESKCKNLNEIIKVQNETNKS